MSQSIKCTHCGSVVKSPKPVEPGKKLKCPKCAKVFVVAEDEEEPEAEEESAAEESAEEEETPKKKGRTAAKDDDEDDEDEKPKKKPGKDKKSKKDEDDAPKKGSNMLLIAGIGGVLLLCCCAGGGGGTCLFWPSKDKDKPTAQDGGKDKIADKGLNKGLDKGFSTDVIVTGVVESLDKNRNLAIMKGQGTANWDISLASGEIDRVKQGDEVELRCRVGFIDDRKAKKGASLEQRRDIRAQDQVITVVITLRVMVAVGRGNNHHAERDDYGRARPNNRHFRPGS
jgi:hypothetical protein